MAVPQKNAGDRFNSSQAKPVQVLGAPRFELGRPVDMVRGADGQQAQAQAQPIPTQGQQGFMGSRQGAAGKGAFIPMQGPVAPRLAPRAPAPPPQPSLGGGDEETVVEVYGVAPDGTELVAPFGAVFPRGTKILGVSGLPPGAQIFTR